MRSGSRHDRYAHRRSRGCAAAFVAALSVCLVMQPLFAGAVLSHSHGDEGSHTHRISILGASACKCAASSSHGHDHDDHSRPSGANRPDGASVLAGEMIVCDADVVLLGTSTINALPGLDLGARRQLASSSVPTSGLTSPTTGLRRALDTRSRLARRRPSKNTADLVRISPALLL